GRDARDAPAPQGRRRKLSGPRPRTLNGNTRRRARRMDRSMAESIAERLVTFLETGTPPPGLFHPDVFCDFTPPQWRVQACGIEEVVQIRKRSHPAPGDVPRWRCDPTPTGFVLELEERWREGGQRWYSREMARADVRDGSISAL